MKNTKNLVKKLIKNTLRRFGYDIISLKYRKNLIDFLNYYKIDVVFDVGANTGQFGSRLREMRYKGKIISFEPISLVYQELNKKTMNDSLWQTINIGLGNYDGIAVINISNNSCFSSILNPLPRVIDFDNKSLPIKKEQININKIDSIFDKFYKNGTKIFLKVDTQGFENEIIQGAINSLNYFSGIQLELATVPLYEGQSSLNELIKLMNDHGFQLVLIEPVNYHNIEPSVMEIDCIFVNKAIVN